MLIGKGLMLSSVDEALRQKIELIRGRFFSSIYELQETLTDENFPVTVTVKSLGFKELKEVLNTAFMFIEQKRKESDILQLLKGEIIPQEWLLEPSLSRFFVVFLKSAVYSHQERLVSLLIEKRADIALINAKPSLAQCMLLSVLIKAGVDHSLQKEVEHRAAIPLIFYLLEKARSDERYSSFLSGACLAEFIQVFQACFSKCVEVNVDHDKGVEVLENTFWFAKENSLAFELPINLQEGLRSIFNLVIKKGAPCLFASILESSASSSHYPKMLASGLRISIKHRRQEEFAILFNLLTQDEQESFVKENLHICMRFDNENAFSAFTPHLNREELSLAAESALDHFEGKYLEKLITLGAQIDFSKTSCRVKLFTLISMLQSSCGEEVLEQFVSSIVSAQINQGEQEELVSRILDAQNTAKELSIPNIIYRVRTASSSPWGMNYGGEEIQDLYDKEFRTTIAGAVFLIGRQIDFKELLEFLSIRRNKMACLANQPKKRLFGLWRTPLMQVKTALTGRYEKYLNRVRQKIEGGHLEGFSKAIITQNEEVEAEVSGLIDGEAIALTRIEKDTWIHTGCAERDKIIDYVKKLYQEVITTPHTFEENPGSIRFA